MKSLEEIGWTLGNIRDCVDYALDAIESITASFGLNHETERLASLIELLSNVVEETKRDIERLVEQQIVVTAIQAVNEVDRLKKEVRELRQRLGSAEG